MNGQQKYAQESKEQAVRIVPIAVSKEIIVTTIAHLFLCLLICRLSMKRMKKPFKSITTKWRYAKVPRRRISKPQGSFTIVRWLTEPI